LGFPSKFPFRQNYLTIEDKSVPCSGRRVGPFRCPEIWTGYFFTSTEPDGRRLITGMLSPVSGSLCRSQRGFWVKRFPFFFAPKGDRSMVLQLIMVPFTRPHLPFVPQLEVLGGFLRRYVGLDVHRFNFPVGLNFLSAYLFMKPSQSLRLLVRFREPLIPLNFCFLF